MGFVAKNFKTFAILRGKTVFSSLLLGHRGRGINTTLRCVTEEEEGTGIASDVVKVEGEDPATGLVQGCDSDCW